MYFCHCNTKNMEQYRKSPRAQFIDYNFGDYFITICTRNKRHYFGEIVNGDMQLSEIGLYLDTQLRRASDYCDCVKVPLYIIMPNHIHAIVQISSGEIDSTVDWIYNQRNPNPSLRPNSTCRRHIPMLSKYITSLKGAVSKYARQKNILFGWQSRYYDHLIRGRRDAENISEYILNNIRNWSGDCYY